MIRRPPRSTPDRSSAASDVYKRQEVQHAATSPAHNPQAQKVEPLLWKAEEQKDPIVPVSYTHLRAHETVLDLVCRLLLEKKKLYINTTPITLNIDTDRHTIKN